MGVRSTTCDTTNIAGAVGTTIGTGEPNTKLIITNAARNASHEAPAVWAAHDYSNSGKSDWFLPSRDELIQLYSQRNVVGGFAAGSYWSSSQSVSGSGYAWDRNFVNGSQFSFYKGNSDHMRPVRAF